MKSGALLKVCSLQVVCTALFVLQMLLNTSQLIGKAIIPYYRQVGTPCTGIRCLLTCSRPHTLSNTEDKCTWCTFPPVFNRLAACGCCYFSLISDLGVLQVLPVFNIFISCPKPVESRLCHSTSGKCIVDLVLETLQLLERKGGPQAFMQIKRMVPTYESILRVA